MKAKLILKKRFPKAYNKIKVYSKRITTHKITLLQLADIIVNTMGIQRGDVVLVHTSLNHMKIEDAFPEDLIFLLKSIIGTQGTLLMPTFPLGTKKTLLSPKPYNNKKTMGEMGMINELFRMMPGTIRSFHPTKSVAAWGKMAEHMTKDHYKSERAFDKNSPFYRLYELQGKAIGIGVSLKNYSYIHTLDDSRQEYFPIKYSEPVEKICIDDAGCTFKRQYRYDLPEATKSASPKILYKYFEKNEIWEFRKNRIPFFVSDARKTYEKALALAKKGITIYGHDVNNKAGKRVV